MPDIILGFFLGFLVSTTLDIFILWILSKNYTLKQKIKHSIDVSPSDIAAFKAVIKERMTNDRELN
jgi:hypothetical protein